MINVQRAIDSNSCHKRKYATLAVPFDNLSPFFVHSSCVHNDLNSVQNRVLKKHPPEVQITQQAIQDLKLNTRYLKWQVSKQVPITPMQLAHRYGGKKRDFYIKGANSIMEREITRADARIDMFCKDEKNEFNPKKRNPAVRPIQARTAKPDGPRYHVAIGTYLKPIEHDYYQIISNWPGGTNTRIIGKGLNARARAALLKDKLAKFGDYVVLSCDCSKFDSHVSKELLEIEHSLYLHCNNSSDFRRLLSYQLHNHGRSVHGIRYKTRGGRMSGDMNTALGNCVIMVLMLITACRSLGIKFDLLDDGDDCLLIIRPTDLDLVLTRLPTIFQTFGHELKFEAPPTSVLNEIRWCKSQIVTNSEGEDLFVRDPRKVMSQALGGTKFAYSNVKTRRALVNTIGLCELMLNQGVPILQEYGIALMRNSRSSTIVQGIEKFHTYSIVAEMQRRHIDKIRPVPRIDITQEARLSFFKAFGISPDRQQVMERQLRKWHFNLEGVDLPLPFHSEWLYEGDRPEIRWGFTYS